MLSDLRPGDIMFGPISGPAGALVAAGQLMLATSKERLGWRQWWRVRHVAVVVEALKDIEHVGQSKPRIVQAMPSGAEEIKIGLEYLTDDFIYLRPNYSSAGSGVTGEAVASYARSYVGTPYSFADYAALALKHWRIPTPHLDRYISDSGHMICSQLADQAMADAGYHVFDDGRLPQDVTPAALYRQMISMPHQNVGPVHHPFRG